ncbi:MAG TPA: hypothetical protein VIL29_01560 [Pseudothermotoga sp.]
MKKAVLLMCLTIFVFSTFFAANFPTKPITYVVCFDPGGESDITARIQQPYLEKILGVPIVITYKAGGGGATGWSELVNRATPDGYSIYGTNLPHIILQQFKVVCLIKQNRSRTYISSRQHLVHWWYQLTAPSKHSKIL